MLTIFACGALPLSILRSATLEPAGAPQHLQQLERKMADYDDDADVDDDNDDDSADYNDDDDDVADGDDNAHMFLRHPRIAGLCPLISSSRR